MQSASQHQFYLSDDPTSAGGSGAPAGPMHPAVLAHLLQQQQLHHQMALLQQPQQQQPQSLTGAPLLQTTTTAPPPLPLLMGGVPTAARSDAGSTSSSIENTMPASGSVSSLSLINRPPSTSSADDGQETVRLHISNIPYKWRNEDLKKMFEQHGEVADAEVIFNDRGSKGFGFVTMAKKEGADTARAAIHGKVFDGRIVEVNGATAKASAKGSFRPKQLLQLPQLPALQPQPSLVMQPQLLQQFGLLHPSQQPSMMQPPLAAGGAADHQQLAALQQLLMAQSVLAQYAAQQQQQQQAAAMMMQQQPQMQQMQQLWLQQQAAAAATQPSMELDKHQRRMAEDLAKRYRPY